MNPSYGLNGTDAAFLFQTTQLLSCIRSLSYAVNVRPEWADDQTLQAAFPSSLLSIYAISFLPLLASGSNVRLGEVVVQKCESGISAAPTLQRKTAAQSASDSANLLQSSRLFRRAPARDIPRSLSPSPPSPIPSTRPSSQYARGPLTRENRGK